MEIKKIIFYFGALLLLTGCFQSTAMVGPAMTLASTGNVFQAGSSFVANQVVEKETGMSTGEHVSTIMDEEKRDQKKFNKRFINLVKSNVEKTRKELLTQSKKKFQ